ncbi:hypothetical protein LZP73_13120 [Shewanella sp. AS16]|uniref:hypothetical protein n=1 Tax=Shewanella sp. AS16 TaxID=2907625 RepID=UPI001F2EB5BD|nr:hypothetical protein [Shewanella sp. AS16]MCE9687133.1 hypothetical protein [Shewanella sp. AS16]
MKKWIKILLLLLVLLSLTQIDFKGSTNLKEAHPIIFKTGLSVDANREFADKILSLDNAYMAKRINLEDNTKLAAIQMYPTSFDNGEVKFVVKFNMSEFSRDEVAELKRRIAYEFGIMAKLQLEKTDELAVYLQDKLKFVEQLVAGGEAHALYEQLDDATKQKLTYETFSSVAGKTRNSLSGAISVAPLYSQAYEKYKNLPDHYDLFYRVNADGEPKLTVKLVVNPANGKVFGIF